MPRRIEARITSCQQAPDIQRYEKQKMAKRQQENDVHLHDVETIHIACDLRDQCDEGGGNVDGDGEAEGLHLGFGHPGGDDGAVPLQVEAYADANTVHIGVAVDCADGHDAMRKLESPNIGEVHYCFGQGLLQLTPICGVFCAFFG